LRKSISAPEAARPRRRPRPYQGWITARQAVQAGALLGFLGLFLAAPGLRWPAGLVNLAMRLDPLLTLAGWLSAGALAGGALLALLTVALTLVFGRAWCGWLCPLGTLLDWITPRRAPAALHEPPQSWRKIKYLLLAGILAAALFGNLTLLVLDPLALLWRGLGAAVLPAVDWTITTLEYAALRLPFLADPLVAVDTWLRTILLPAQPLVYQGGLLIGGLLAGVALLNWAAPRFWCRYLCPLGGLLGLLSRAALFRRQVGEECKGCALCERACPTGTIDPQRGYASDPAECTLCLECLPSCPKSVIAFTPGFSLAPAQAYDPGRRQFLAAAGTAIAGAAILGSLPEARRLHPHRLRPPGASEDALLDRCVRCAACLRACPTNALQPAIGEAGPEGLWTPIVAPRLGYCEYACNVCGQVCPVEAIPPLALEDKRQQVIGLAYINQDRCIAWADGRDCIVCEEMCPVPDKAIWLETGEVRRADGSLATVQRPHVDRQRCIGCGICEYQCPVAGEAAIRVYIPGALTQF
jgi:polyferredoxin